MSDQNSLPVPQQLVDASGLRCPLPILRAKKALAQMQGGQLLKVITTDPHAVRDFQAFCAQTGNELVAQIQAEGAQDPEGAHEAHHYLRRRRDPSQ